MSFILQRCIWEIPPETLSDKDFRILSYYAFIADDQSFLAWPKQETVAQKCNCSTRTVRRTLSKLQVRDDNIIFTVNRKGGRAATQYEMCFPGMEPKVEAKKRRIISFEERRRTRGPSTKKLAADLQRTNARIDTLFQEGQG